MKYFWRSEQRELSPEFKVFLKAELDKESFI